VFSFFINRGDSQRLPAYLTYLSTGKPNSLRVGRFQKEIRETRTARNTVFASAGQFESYTGFHDVIYLLRFRTDGK